eukprot:GGOE01009378.1.p1 GENE.GGOE01009378.1~~GGOE01009378.1.p1  ORF type:complete len:274 (-),score=51.06 GGOE01009378.1:2036-2818(-)
MANHVRRCDVPADIKVEIFRSMMAQEMCQKRPTHDLTSAFIQCRPILMAYSIQVCKEFALSAATCHRACHLMDRIFTSPDINRDGQKPNFQLVLLVCIAVAAKFEETTNQQPCIADLLDSADGQYELEDFFRVERFALNYLQWEVNDVTAVCFAGFYFSNTAIGSPAVDSEVETKVIQLLDMTLRDYGFCCYLPSLLSAAALKMARWIVREQRGLSADALGWGPEMVSLTQYTSEDLDQCCSHLWHRCITFGSGRSARRV